MLHHNRKRAIFIKPTIWENVFGTFPKHRSHAKTKAWLRSERVGPGPGTFSAGTPSRGLRQRAWSIMDSVECRGEDVLFFCFDTMVNLPTPNESCSEIKGLRRPLFEGNPMVNQALDHKVPRLGRGYPVDKP